MQHPRDTHTHTRGIEECVIVQSPKMRVIWLSIFLMHLDTMCHGRGNNFGYTLLSTSFLFFLVQNIALLHTREWGWTSGLLNGITMCLLSRGVSCDHPHHKHIPIHILFIFHHSSLTPDTSGCWLKTLQLFPHHPHPSVPFHSKSLVMTF